VNIHDKLPDEFKEVLKNKKFLLFKHAIEKANYEDEELPGRMVAGFQIPGKLESSNVFKLESSNVFDKCQPKNQFPITVEDLARSSIWTRHVVHATTKPSGDPELGEVIYSMTLDECGKGWLRGPFSP
jgi:hypothetical protein